MALSHKLDDDMEEASEINLTPFIDVILVLLIIFMIAAQASSVSQAVDLPSSSAKPTAQEDKPVVVAILANRQLSVNDRPVARAGLAHALAAIGTKRDDRVLLAADKTQTYEALMDTFDDLRTAGYTHVALVGRER